MYWIVQSNIYNEENYEHLLSNLERLGLPHSVHKAVPFTGELDPDPIIPEGQKVIVMGSYSLARHAVRRGWRPGAFLDNLDFEIQHKHWGDHMLNADAKIYPFAQVPFQEYPFFIRPVGDSKAFTGLVCDWGYYENWRDGLIRLPETADPVNDPLGINVMTVETPVMVCRKKEIYNETRTWVINGSPKIMVDKHLTGHRVRTCSGYKVGTIKRYTSPEQVDQGIIDFANARAAEWSPNDAYVLDVAEIEDPEDKTRTIRKIVEVNNLNSAGWYKCDMQKLIIALENLG